VKTMASQGTHESSIPPEAKISVGPRCQPGYFCRKNNDPAMAA